MPTFEDWQALRVRVGTVARAEPHPGSRQPALCLWIDFGDLGQLQSSARLTDLYTVEDLVGRQVVAVTGLPPIRVAGFRSDVLILGAFADDGTVVLLRPDRPVAAGSVVA